ncbi:tetratricopeptide repeat protein [Maribacter sp. CXY002]|uniref:tetratricopeptide repeat protein n=1 Tax=Maribacter luteocoastalis TaxID=3407671 RepID=UPI003B6716E0
MKNSPIKMKNIPILFLLLFMVKVITAQEVDVKEKAKALKTSKNLTWEGNRNLSDNNFIQAEVDYRMAIAKSSENAAAPYNLGNAYYNNETYSEAFGRFKEAGETATTKQEKHKAYHNMGNVFMKRKEYDKAVEAYKEALRNNPKDEETRYNLALAKELLKKQQDENKDKNDENKDQQDQQDKKDQDQNKEGDNKDENKDKKDQGDQGDEGDKNDEGEQGDEKKDENKEGDGDEKKEQNKKPEQGDQPQQPRPNQLSKQQVENLLRAMQNAEKKVQDKIDAKKIKGAKVKNEKDW